MRPQHVAARSSCKRCFDAGRSQATGSGFSSYLLHRLSSSFPQGYTQVAYPQKVEDGRHFAAQLPVERTDRRLTCQRASRALLPFPCWPSWQHAAQITQATLKSLWSLTQARLPFSRRSTASFKHHTGRAFAPVPHRATCLGGAA